MKLPVTGQDNEVFECSFCKVDTQHILLNKENRFSHTVPEEVTVGQLSFSKDLRRDHCIYACVRCKRNTYFLVRVEQRVNPGVLISRTGTIGGGPTMVDIYPKIFHRFPSALVEAHSSLPERVRKALIEAETCFHVGAFQACGTMARLAIEEIARLEKAQGRDLFNRIDDLKSKGFLTTELTAIAHKIREGGRNGAHADFEDITQEQASAVLFLLKEVLRELYIDPAERQVRMRMQFERRPGP